MGQKALKDGFCLEASVAIVFIFSFFHFVSGYRMICGSLKYWSTLTTRGRRDVAREEEVVAVEVEEVRVSL